MLQPVSQAEQADTGVAHSQQALRLLRNETKASRIGVGRVGQVAQVALVAHVEQPVETIVPPWLQLAQLGPASITVPSIAGSGCGATASDGDGSCAKTLEQAKTRAAHTAANDRVFILPKPPFIKRQNMFSITLNETLP